MATADLTALQRDLLLAVVDTPGASGRELGERVQPIHGLLSDSRLYHNLRRLSDAGLLQVNPNGRMNEYRPTERGRNVVENYRRWLEVL